VGILKIHRDYQIMPRRKLPYTEGDWFAVPLRSSGYGIGVVAPMDKRGGILAYFFGPRREQMPMQVDIDGLSSPDAILIRHVGDLGLLEGKWQVIGHSETWDRSEWPVPKFARISIDEARAWRVTYSEEDGVSFLTEKRVDVAEVRHLPKDGLSGYRALEIQLDMLLPSSR
jgi:hypothetical protein